MIIVGFVILLLGRFCGRGIVGFINIGATDGNVILLLSRVDNIVGSIVGTSGEGEGNNIDGAILVLLLFLFIRLIDVGVSVAVIIMIVGISVISIIVGY